MKSIHVTIWYSVALAFILFLSSFLLEKDASKTACPLDATQEEFAAAINPLICHAVNDFKAETGDETEGTETYRMWEVKNLNFPGAVDKFITLSTGDGSDLNGKDLVLMFQCGAGKNKSDAMQYFKNFNEAIEQLKPACTTLNLVDKLENLNKKFLRATTWKGEIKKSTGFENTGVELNLKIINETYWVVLHVNSPK